MLRVGRARNLADVEKLLQIDRVRKDGISASGIEKIELICGFYAKAGFEVL